VGYLNDLERSIRIIHYSQNVRTIDIKREEIAEWVPNVRTMFNYNQNSNYHQYDLWIHSVHTVLGILIFNLF